MQDKDNCTKCQTECEKCGISVCTKCVKSGREKEKRECPRCKEMEEERKRKTDRRNEISFRVCTYYLQGRCRFGNFCRNKHTTQIRRANKCKYYEQNRCRFGNRCRNLHQRQNQEDKETRTESRERETEEALEEGLLRADEEGKLTCKCCETKVLSWRQHSVSEKHRKNIKYKQEKLNEGKKRKEKEEEKESQETSIEEAISKGIIEVDENRKLACKICKTQVVGWSQHRRSE